VRGLWICISITKTCKVARLTRGTVILELGHFSSRKCRCIGNSNSDSCLSVFAYRTTVKSIPARQIKLHLREIGTTNHSPYSPQYEPGFERELPLLSVTCHQFQRIWVKRDQLDVTCFIISLFNAQYVSDVNTSILRSLRLIRWVTSWVVSGSMCVGVTLQCGYGGVVSVCRLKPAYGYHTTINTLQRNTNTHRTRYNSWSNSTN